MLPRAPRTEGLVPYLVFLECSGDSKRQYLVEGPSSTGCVPFRGQEGPTLSPPCTSFILYLFMLLLFPLKCQEFIKKKANNLYHKHIKPSFTIFSLNLKKQETL